MRSDATYLGKKAFEIRQGDHVFQVDTTPENGGENRGPSPKGLLLSGLIGCTGVDIVSVLEKMRMAFDRFELSAECDVTESHPKVFKEITLRYLFVGNALDLDKVKKAIDLSMEKYCGVSAMLKKNSEILIEVYFNGEKVL